ncbi:MAG: DUF5329 family protein [Candidatus Omnitrophica bacterium]|nr:DUF5329 family protein [Candidatus Omnitrophota bacterium]
MKTECRRILLSKGIFALILILCAGCAAKTHQHPESTSSSSGMLLSESPDLHKIKIFNRLLEAYPESPDIEDLKIQYLLERVQMSQIQFIRNGEVYGGVRAMMHLRWKYLRKKQNVHTAEDFIRLIATGSSISGRKYMIKMDKNQTCPLDSLLYNELRYLERILITQAAVKEQWETERDVKEPAEVVDLTEAEAETVTEPLP